MMSPRGLAPDTDVPVSRLVNTQIQSPGSAKNPRFRNSKIYVNTYVCQSLCQTLSFRMRYCYDVTLRPGSRHRCSSIEASHSSNSKLRLCRKSRFRNSKIYIHQSILQLKILLSCHHEACSKHSFLSIKASRSSNANLRLCQNPSSVIPNFVSISSFKLNSAMAYQPCGLLHATSLKRSHLRSQNGKQQI